MPTSANRPQPEELPDAHQSTLEVYERRATEWQAQRPGRLDEAVVFARRALATGGPTIDVGCGPGWHLPVLPPDTIAVDGARSMLDLAAARAPSCAGVQADLRALPFRRHSCGAAWANKSYVHLDRRLVPRALWDLHRVVRPDGVAFVSVFMGDSEHETYEGDPFAGRSFSLWTEPLLAAVVEGAGFDVLDRVDLEDTNKGYVGLTLYRRRALADLVGPQMRLLLVGLNASLYSADSGVGFGRPGNRAWPALLASGLAAVDRDPVRLLDDRRIGMTDLVKRPTARANEVSSAEFRHGAERLDLLCRWLQPGAVCVLGLSGWRAA
ncbi:MAG: methyltransferase domain-containing protein, partial [Actinomycetes bacterium]